MLKFLGKVQLRTMSTALIILMIGVGIFVAWASYRTLNEVKKIEDRWNELQSITALKSRAFSPRF